MKDIYKNDGRGGLAYGDIFLEYSCGIIILWIISSLFGWLSWLLWLMVIIGVMKTIEFVCSYSGPERHLRNILDAIQLKCGFSLKKIR